MNVSNITNSLTKIIRDAGKIMLGANKNRDFDSKAGTANFVTAYDVAVQDFLIKSIKDILPEAVFMAEEKENDTAVLFEKYCFIIDPIDGTMNFVRGFNHSCISMAYAHEGEVCAACVYNPYMDEMFTAVKGRGAYLNGKRLTIQDRPLSDSVVCFGTSPYYQELTDITFAITKEAFKAALDLRREASAELDLCSVAASRAGIFFELRLSMWDYAAGALIISEAGGRCCTIEGEALPYDGNASSVAAGCPSALEEFLRIAKACQ